MESNFNFDKGSFFISDKKVGIAGISAKLIIVDDCLWKDCEGNPYEVFTNAVKSMKECTVTGKITVSPDEIYQMRDGLRKAGIAFKESVELMKRNIEKTRLPINEWIPPSVLNSCFDHETQAERVMHSRNYRDFRQSIIGKGGKRRLRSWEK